MQPVADLILIGQQIFCQRSGESELQLLPAPLTGLRFIVSALRLSAPEEQEDFRCKDLASSPGKFVSSKCMFEVPTAIYCCARVETSEGSFQAFFSVCVFVWGCLPLGPFLACFGFSLFGSVYSPPMQSCTVLYSFVFLAPTLCHSCRRGLHVPRSLPAEEKKQKSLVFDLFFLFLLLLQPPSTETRNLLRRGALFETPFKKGEAFSFLGKGFEKGGFSKEASRRGTSWRGLWEEGLFGGRFEQYRPMTFV